MSAHIIARIITRLRARFDAPLDSRASLRGLIARSDDHLLEDIGLSRGEAEAMILLGLAAERAVDERASADTSAPGSRVATRALPCCQPTC